MNIHKGTAVTVDFGPHLTNNGNTGLVDACSAVRHLSPSTLLFPYPQAALGWVQAVEANEGRTPLANREFMITVCAPLSAE